MTPSGGILMSSVGTLRPSMRRCSMVVPLHSRSSRRPRHAAEGRLAEFACRQVVVHTQNGNVVRDIQSQSLAFVDENPCPVIVDGQNGNRRP